MIFDIFDRFGLDPCCKSNCRWRLEVIFDIFDRFGDGALDSRSLRSRLEVIFDIFDRFGMQTRPSGGERPAAGSDL